MMRLSDIVGKIGAAFYVEVALILFFAVFVSVLIYAFVILGSDTAEHFAAMPLEDTEVSMTTASQGSVQ